VAQHLKTCPECSAVLAGFRQLTALSGELADPEPPDDWNLIEKQLAASNTIQRTGAEVIPFPGRRLLQRSRGRFRIRVLPAAATILLALGLSGAYFSGYWKEGRQDEHIAANFEAFLDDFEENPQAAQQALIADYGGRRVDLNMAATLVGFEPAVSRGLPPGYGIDAVFVLDMPCCKCPQAIYRRSDGGTIAVFEHEADQPIWFGDHPSIQAPCSGKPTRIIEVDKKLLAATWPSRNRFLTVIGARDLDEVAQLVAHFEHAGETVE
jgi:hypothetical protein